MHVASVAGFTGVDMWLSILRHHALADDAPRTEHSEPPTGSVHLPERIATQEKVAVPAPATTIRGNPLFSCHSHYSHCTLQPLCINALTIRETRSSEQVLRQVMSPSALRKVAGETLSESDASVDAEAQELTGPGEVEDGVEWEDVTDGVYLLIEHTQTKREGHTFKFRLRKST